MVYRTYEEWNAFGYYVKKGEKGEVSVNHKIVFSQLQVEKKEKLIIFDSNTDIKMQYGYQVCMQNTIDARSQEQKDIDDALLELDAEFPGLNNDNP